MTILFYSVLNAPCTSLCHQPPIYKGLFRQQLLKNLLPRLHVSTCHVHHVHHVHPVPRSQAFPKPHQWNVDTWITAKYNATCQYVHILYYICIHIRYVFIYTFFYGLNVNQQLKTYKNWMGLMGLTCLTGKGQCDPESVDKKSVAHGRAASPEDQAIYHFCLHTLLRRDLHRFSSFMALGMKHHFIIFHQYLSHQNIYNLRKASK